MHSEQDFSGNRTSTWQSGEFFIPKMEWAAASSWWSAQKTRLSSKMRSGRSDDRTQSFETWYTTSFKNNGTSLYTREGVLLQVCLTFHYAKPDGVHQYHIQNNIQQNLRNAHRFQSWRFPSGRGQDLRQYMRNRIKKTKQKLSRYNTSKNRQVVYMIMIGNFLLFI